MIKTACKKPQQVKESPGNNAAQLRLLRNKFLKQYVQSDKQLSSEHLTAFLLYFTLRFLEQNKGLHNLIGNSKLANKTIVKLTSSDLFSIGKELFNIVKAQLPVNLNQVMVVPNEVSWREASIFFEKQNNDFIFTDIANLGFAYQIFSLGMRTKQALPALQKADKRISRQELIAFTQLYTPSWVVDFLIANTVLSGYNKAGVSKRYLQWLIADKNMNEMQLSKCSLLDPACGSGQFLFSAFDLLIELAEQDGYDTGEASQTILSENIFGADIDEKALWVAGLGLTSKCLLIDDFVWKKKLNLSWVTTNDVSEKIEECNFLGSIDKRLNENHFLKNSYKIIVTNPPYLGRKCLSRELKTTLKEQYPKSSNDLAAAFIEHCVDMLEPGGRFGVITQASLLAIPSYQGLRDYLISNYHLAITVRCGPGVFPLSSGEKIDSLLLLLKAPGSKKAINKKQRTCFVDLSNEKEKEQQLVNIISDSANGKNDNRQIIFTEQTNMQDTGMLFSGLPSVLFEKIAQFPKLGDIAEIRQGLATTDNNRFVRYHFDVDKELIGTVWVPYIKGAGGQRYATSNPFVVKWADNGKEIKEAVSKAYPYLKGKTAWVVKNEEYYFRPGLCFSFINKEGLAVRRLPAGAIFDVASSAIFAAPEEEDFLLAYLNSTFVGVLAKAINQSINLQVGDLKKIPICPFDNKIKNELSDMGRRCFEITENLLRLQNIEFYSGEACLTSDDLELLFKKCSMEQRMLVEELEKFQRDIDDKVRTGVEELGLRSEQESELTTDLENVVQSVNNKRDSLLDTKLFAYRMLMALISKMISNNDGDKVRSIIISEENSFAQFFDISSCAQNWLEQKLDKSFRQLFCRSKILDICKLAGAPSRYFSLWLEENDSCIFFSSSAVRSLPKVAKQAKADFQALLVLQPIITQLELLPDWTSRDLYRIIDRL